MEVVRWEPFESLNKMHARINDLFGENFGRSWAKPSSATWYPPVDVLESKDSYLIRAELPGMKKEDFHLEVKDGTLTLTGSENPRRRLTASNIAAWNGLAESSGDRSRFRKP